MVPLLAEAHRVIRVDLLSASTPSSPATAYDIETLGRRVAAVLAGLGVTRVTVVGQRHELAADRWAGRPGAIDQNLA